MSTRKASKVPLTHNTQQVSDCTRGKPNKKTADQLQKDRFPKYLGIWYNNKNISCFWEVMT